MPDYFAEDFPDLADALIEFYESEGPASTGETLYCKPFSLRKIWGRDRGVRLCGNRLCKRGGYNLAQCVRDTIREGTGTKSFVLRCPGDEGSFKGRRMGRRCMNLFHCRITIQ